MDYVSMGYRLGDIVEWIMIERCRYCLAFIWLLCVGWCNVHVGECNRREVKSCLRIVVHKRSMSTWLR